MANSVPFEILLVTAPGLELPLRSEAIELGFKKPNQIVGGVTIMGDWHDVWRANLEMRGASRILVRLGEFHVAHLAQLDKKARQFPWEQYFRTDTPLRVDVSCKKSKIYHQKAAKERIERAIHEELGAPISADADLVIKVRIFEDLCTISFDSSGDGLHIRGHKEALNKAPMRETMAALLLRKCGYNGKEPLLDPMCGSGTFVIEAAEMALGLQAGRSREFAFEQLATFDQDAFEALKTNELQAANLRFFGSDRNEGAIANAQANAERAGVAEVTGFHKAAISDMTRPDCAPGLVIVNPPYGARIGNKKLLFGLYGSLGQKLKEDFKGWRVGIITSDTGLARATGLPGLRNGPPIPHGGLKVKLFEAGPL